MLDTVMDRLLANLLFALSLAAICGAVMLLLGGFVEYLQSDAWRSISVLQFGYDTHLIRAQWFLAHDWSWGIHDVLEAIPLYAALLGFAPVSWWLSGRVAR